MTVMQLPSDTAGYISDLNAALTRRQFFRKTATGLGVAALSYEAARAEFTDRFAAFSARDQRALVKKTFR